MIRLYIKANVIPDPNKEVVKKEKKNSNIHFVKPISVKKLYELKDLSVLDFRSQEEFEKGHLKMAKSIPFAGNDFKKVVFGLNKDSTYLIYASNEKEISTISELLQHFAFKEVYVLHGGYKEWMKFNERSDKK